jgi:DNA invertase Pin-like site-specific DNA recombinase
MLIGYARVSAHDQSLDLQHKALTKAGCRKIFEDKTSGARADRPGFAKALEALCEGDTLVVAKLDRLGRSVKQLVDLIDDLHKRGVHLKSLADAIDTDTPSGHAFFHVMTRLAETERELTVERTRTGLEVARQLGRTGGRKPKMTDSKIKSARKQLASGVPPKDVARNLGVSIPTLYRWVPASTHAWRATFCFPRPAPQRPASIDRPSTPATVCVPESGVSAMATPPAPVFASCCATMTSAY